MHPRLAAHAPIALLAALLIAGFIPAASAQPAPTKAAQIAQSGDGDDSSLIDDSGGDDAGTDDTGSDDIDVPPDGDSGATDQSALSPDVGPPKDIRPGSYTLEARLAADDPPLGGDAVRWRIYGDTPGDDGRLPLLGQASGGIIYVRLDPGTYYIHAAYGRAGATRKVAVTEPTGGEVFVLNAGGMRLNAINGKDETLSPDDVNFEIYAPDDSGAEERYLLVPNAKPGHIIALNAGTYHVVSHYGSANAVVRTDIKVDPGKLTEATVFQHAARLTLKLVEQHGGEAIADTAWTVETISGEPVLDTVGAFPSTVLAAGDYTAIAKHDGRSYQLNFNVQTGQNRDVEVLTR